MSDTGRHYTVAYAPGPMLAIAGGRACFLGRASSSGKLAPSLWELVQTGAPAPTIADQASEPVDGDPADDFAVISDLPRGVTVAIVGSAEVELRTDDGCIRLSCPAGAARAVYEFGAPPTEAVLSIPADYQPDSALLPLAAGVVSASSVVASWSTSESDKVIPEAQTVAIEPEPEPPFPPADVAEPERPLPQPDVAEPEPPLPPVDVAEPEPPPPPVEVRPPVHVPSSEDTILPGAPEPTPEASSSGFDHLFGRTINRTVEEAAVRPSDEPAPAQTPPAPPPAQTPLAPPEPIQAQQPEAPPVTPAGPSVVAPSTGMIDSVPWADPAPTRQQPAAEPAQDENPAELTIHRGAHQALLRQMSAPGNLQTLGPTVHAVRCPNGHLNPTHLPVCRICTGAISEQSPVTVPRPVLGVLRLSSGDDIVLDRAVLLGRSPSLDRLVDGERPHVVKLPSPGQDISRNHVEVRIDGWHVLVTDLNSTNGTIVTRPGVAPERLRPNDAAMIEPGTVVSIADEVSFTFVAT